MKSSGKNKYYKFFTLYQKKINYFHSLFSLVISWLDCFVVYVRIFIFHFPFRPLVEFCCLIYFNDRNSSHIYELPGLLIRNYISFSNRISDNHRLLSHLIISFAFIISVYLKIFINLYSLLYIM